jgi:flagellar biosynthetic protein FliR
VDPLTGSESLPTTRLLSTLSVAVILILQGHPIVLRALAGSVRIAPPGHTFEVALNEGALRVGSQLVAHGLQIASPVLGTMFILYLGKGLLSKAAPKVQLLAVIFSLAIGAGLVTVWLAAPSIANAVSLQVERLPDALADALGGG